MAGKGTKVDRQGIGFQTQARFPIDLQSNIVLRQSLEFIQNKVVPKGSK